MNPTIEHLSRTWPNHINASPTNLTNPITGTLRFSFGITAIIYCIYLLPFCFGVFGNVSVCLVFFQQKKLRSITNTFLMNLCKLRKSSPLSAHDRRYFLQVSTISSFCVSRFR